MSNRYVISLRFFEWEKESAPALVLRPVWVFIVTKKNQDFYFLDLSIKKRATALLWKSSMQYNSTNRIPLKYWFCILILSILSVASAPQRQIRFYLILNSILLSLHLLLFQAVSRIFLRFHSYHQESGSNKQWRYYLLDAGCNRFCI